MKRIALCKTNHSPVLAHLYEHLYCRALTEMFRGKGLIRDLDYYYEARTYGSGIILLDVYLYTKEAEKCAAGISQQELPLDDRSLSMGIAQVNAERHQRLVGDSVESIAQGLRKVHLQQWQELEHVGSYDTHAVHRNRRSAWYTDEITEQMFRTMKCELLLDEAVAGDRAIAPLFYLVSRIVEANLADGLIEVYGYFSEGHASSTYTAKAAKEIYDFSAFTPVTSGLTDEIESCRNDIATMLQLGLAHKMTAYLQGATYKHEYAVPNEIQVYEATGALVGAQGWREIGTQANIIKLLHATTLTLTYGKQKQSLRIGDLL